VRTIQLLLAPVLAYLLTPGLYAEPLALAAVCAVVAALGFGALRRRAVPWIVLLAVMTGTLAAAAAGVVGIVSDHPWWSDVLAVLLSALVLRALLARSGRPRPQVWAALLDRRWLVVAGAALIAVMVSTDDPADTRLGEAGVVAYGVAVVIWTVLVVRAVRDLRRGGEPEPVTGTGDVGRR
jgi:Na+-transporting NADH:ubiquinone oxidoreductase subunit NqrB